MEESEYVQAVAVATDHLTNADAWCEMGRRLAQDGHVGKGSMRLRRLVWIERKRMRANMTNLLERARRPEKIMTFLTEHDKPDCG